MTSKTSGSRKLKRSNLPKFDHDIYSRISLNNLIVYSVYYLLEQKVEVRMEDIVFACFLLFPQKFALKKYPRWPDSAVISRRWGDCRSKGYISANADAGIKLTAKGSRLAEKVAKVLGVSTTKRVVKALPSKPKEHAGTPAKKIKSVIHKKKITVPAKVERIISSRPKAYAATPAMKTKIVRKKKTTRQAQQAAVPGGDVQSSHGDTSRKTARGAVSAQVKKTRPAQMNNARLSKTRQAQASILGGVSLAPSATLSPSKASGRAGLRVKPTPSPVQGAVSSLSSVPKDVKIRAGKFVHLMERSDAYIHYKKNGKKSGISEFDFRSLLLCTMESSRETLARNVELFKGYASIHGREDLVTFLNYCEEYFFSLLHPAKNTGRKK